MKKKALLVIALLLSNISFSQTTDFEKYKLSNVGFISIPSKMELQSGIYKKRSEKYQKEISEKFGFEVSGNRIVFQQKGLNDNVKSGFSTYSRVILETEIGQIGDFEKLTNNYNLTQAELVQINDEIINQVKQSFNGTGLRIINWYGVSVKKINGRTALKVSYLRQLNDNPYVLVDMYSFQNNDRMHRLTLSYRQSDGNTWKPLFSKILNSFTITNVR